MWNYISCPACDFTWSFSTDGSAATSAPTPDPAAEKVDTKEPLSLAAAFAQLDKFCAHILTAPGAAQNTEIRKHLDSLAAVKEQLVLSRAESLSHLKVQDDRIAAMQASAKAGEEAHQKKMDAANQPPPHLDGSALSAALLKNLGFK
jgi:hypothetical protein